ncbi:MAG: hypothetical protein J5I98_05565 [Phaeodactylibacter sp.]|nr:hypothetical protein [Phaeodactylibacter sp.]
MAESSKGPGRRDFHANPMLGKAEALGFIVAAPYHRPVVDLCLIAEPLAAPFLFGKLFINAVQSPWLERCQH